METTATLRLSPLPSILCYKEAFSMAWEVATMNKHPKQEKLRRMAAYEAARILVESGDDNYHRARSKAAERLQLRGRDQLPDYREITHAITEYLALYGGEKWRQQLAALRRTACQAMERFAPFHPRLVGPVLEGTAVGEHSRVQLHLFADYPEAIHFYLHDLGICFEEGERELRFAEGSRRCPLLRFIAGEHSIELICLTPHERRTPPLHPGDQRPHRGASLAEVQALRT